MLLDKPLWLAPCLVSCLVQRKVAMTMLAVVTSSVQMLDKYLAISLDMTKARQMELLWAQNLDAQSADLKEQTKENKSVNLMDLRLEKLLVMPKEMSSDHL